VVSVQVAVAHTILSSSPSQEWGQSNYIPHQHAVTGSRNPDAFACFIACLQRIRYVDLSAATPVLASVAVSLAVPLSQPVGITVFGSPATVPVADSLNDVIRRFDKSGPSWTLGSDVGLGNTVMDGSLAETTLVDPRGIAVASDGSVWIAGGV
jgi:hypothetical protein